MVKLNVYFVVVLLCFASPLLGEEQPAQWHYFGGASSPLSSKEGQSNAFINMKWSDVNDNRYSVQIRSQELKFQSPLNERMDFVLSANLTKAGELGALYQNGKHEDLFSEFTASNLGVGYSYYFFPPTLTEEVKFEFAFIHYNFTAKETNLEPQIENYFEANLGISGKIKRQNKKSEISNLAFAFTYQTRSEQGEWELESERPRESYLFTTNFEGLKSWEQATTKFTWDLGKSEALDFMNAFKIGGFNSEVVIPGYYKNEFRAGNFFSLGLAHEFVFSGQKRLGLQYKLVQFSSIQSKVINSEEILPQGMGLNFTLSLGMMEAKMGYGQGLVVAPSSVQKERKEVYLGLAGSF